MGKRRMRGLVLVGNVFALALTLQSCTRVAPPAGGPVAGTPAPEITGEDLDGVPFKLSDYRGKVVLLSFWGDW